MAGKISNFANGSLLNYYNKSSCGGADALTLLLLVAPRIASAAPAI